MLFKIQDNFNIRYNFGKNQIQSYIPNLIDIQKKSYERFLQLDIKSYDRKSIGLQRVFQSTFPIEDYNDSAFLEFINYNIGTPKYKANECRIRGITFSAPLRIKVKFTTRNISKIIQQQNKNLNLSINEQSVYSGEIPLMTEFGTFIINGIDRVVVSQLHRCPGVCFENITNKLSNISNLYNGRIIPYRGSWLDFEIDSKNILYCRIDRRRKFHASILLKALGYKTEQLLKIFCDIENLSINADYYIDIKEYNLLEGQYSITTVVDPETKKTIIKQNDIFDNNIINKIKLLNIKKFILAEEDLESIYFAEDIKNPATNEVIAFANEIITIEKINIFKKYEIKSIKVIYNNKNNINEYLKNTLLQDKINSQEEAVLEIYKKIRPGDPPTLETAEALIYNLFFNPERYDLSTVGRLKLNHKLKLSVPLEQRVLTHNDIISVIQYLMSLRNGKGNIDDIDHLGNRRVRSVGELVENQFRIGLIRMERSIREKMSINDVNLLTPHDLINSKPLTAVIKEFFGSSQLSQFMDQTNPLSEITHKRRLSALGPGGLTRDRAGFKVRDVHLTHYGRICPIETPEGPNIGLIASLAIFAQVNEYGFIETPYRKIKNNIIKDKIKFFSALDEENEFIAQASFDNDFKNILEVRKNGETIITNRKKITWMDISPNQLVSIAASLIPFLEHDDANRALMGSNMQRQAVPLLRPESPLVGTGMEAIFNRDTGVCNIAKSDGIVKYVDFSRVVIKSLSKIKNNKEYDKLKVDIYRLDKYQRSNQDTCINQKPIVSIGDVITTGDIITDGPSMQYGELALGKNVIVAFMPWHGYNFEDSILVNERLIKDDLYTSIHIEEYEIVARDTKLGPEEITRDIPNASEEALGKLDASGIIQIGTFVKSGDILVGKITPKGETQLSPEEKLIRAIFGDKASNVQDTSLRMHSGASGVIIDIKIFNRRGLKKSDRAQKINQEEKINVLKDRDDEINIILKSGIKKIWNLLDNKIIINNIIIFNGKILIQSGTKLNKEQLKKIKWKYYDKIKTADKFVNENIKNILIDINKYIRLIEKKFEECMVRLQESEELLHGVISLIKICVAIKRRLQPGDKMSGRHGNKGVISKVLPEEDMPYLPCGTPIDVILNPLGVPSRMNVGQVLETHLGWAAKSIGNKMYNMLMENNFNDIRRILKQIFKTNEKYNWIHKIDQENLKKLIIKMKNGIKVATPVFNGASEEQIRNFLLLSDKNTEGQTILFDGQTGECFEQNITIGVMYILKLHHLVDEKLHARSVGPYSLVTQQPLGGKAQFGGQRLGEMEVWALEGYGAAYALQEFLTVKSDDVTGRTKMYEAIVKGEHVLESSVPESFNVLMKELQSLGLDIQLFEDIEEPIKSIN